jgi:ferric-dicitrate binding protein FerR (iron transport regulator)
LTLSTNDNDIDDLIASYLVGEATALEIERVEAWRNQSVSNQKYFDQLKLIFDKASTVTGTPHFETDAAWRKLRTKLHMKGEAKTIALDTRPLSAYRFALRVAAGIVVLIIAGLFAFQYFSFRSTESMQVLADEKTEADTLPDGSDVFLNRQTTIEYEFNRKKNAHTAKLVGEAYFNINHSDDKTFIVEAGGVFIKDIGTSFNVKAYPDAETIEVVVEEGEVMFYSEGNAGIYLKANGKGIYNRKTKIFTVADPEPNVTAYKTKFFSFSDNDLASVIKAINDVYPGKIEIDQKLARCRLTVSFNNETLEEITAIIAETLGVSVKKSGKVFRLEGTGCNEDS